MVRQGGLGRGLASLIPRKKSNDEKEGNGEEDPQAKANYFGAAVEDEVRIEKPAAKKETESRWGGAKLEEMILRSVVEVPVGKIIPNPHQPRTDFDQRRLAELADSIRQHGVLQPLVVTQKAKDEYELIAGERRLQASKLAGKERVPVIIKKVSEQAKLELALIENIQRHDLNPIEEARAYKKMQDLFSLTQEEVAKRSGKSRSAVANSMRLLGLPVEIQRALAEGRISEGHARTILAIVNPEKQRALFQLILKDQLTVRQAEDKVRQVTVGTHQRKLRAVDPELDQAQQKLSESLGTKVKIKKSRTGGQIIIDFYADEEYQSLMARLAS